MILKTIKTNALKRSIEKNIVENQTSKTLSQLSHVLVVVNAVEFQDFEKLNALPKVLNIPVKNFKIITFTESNNELANQENGHFTNKDFNWLGNLNSLVLKDLLAKNYDLFIGYYSKKNPYLDYLSSIVNACLKVSFEGVDQRIFDIIFKTNSTNYTVFETELKRYIQILSPKMKSL